MYLSVLLLAGVKHNSPDKTDMFKRKADFEFSARSSKFSSETKFSVKG